MMSFDFNSLHAGIFFMIFLSSVIFFIISFSKFFLEYHQSVKQFDTGQPQHSFGSDQRSNRLQKL